MQRSFPRLVLMLALAVVTTAALAKKVYKYQDEDGRWHFTDVEPATSQPVESRTIQVEHRDKIKISRRGPDNHHALYIYNSYHGPVEVTLSFTEVAHITAEPPLPHRFLIPPRRELRAVSLKMDAGAHSYNYHIGAKLILGDSRLTPSTQAIYRLPFDGGKSFEVTQAFRGEYSHNTPYSEYAVDIAMPEGTPILAARDGVVMDIERDFFGNGMDLEKFGSRANHVRVLHDDGTMAEYAHLQLESVRVVTGARVVAGQVIGASGNTGFSSGPHLHFSVQYNAGTELRSLPFQFRLRDGRDVVPRRGLTLSAY